MKLYYFNKETVLSAYTKEPRKIYEAEVEEKAKTFIVKSKNPYWIMRKEAMEFFGYRFFRTIEEAKEALLATIKEKIEESRKEAKRLLADADRLVVILNEGE